MFQPVHMVIKGMKCKFGAPHVPTYFFILKIYAQGMVQTLVGTFFHKNQPSIFFKRIDKGKLM
jgi:hypothetical protein